MPAYDRNLIMLGLETNDAADALRTLGKKMVMVGVVHKSFPDAVIKRESEYPTGLPGLGVAIPHTTSDHVIEPAIAIAQLVKPVSFSCMGDPDEVLDVDLIFLLAIKDPKAQLSTLKMLMSTFQDEDAMNNMRSAPNMHFFELALMAVGWENKY